MTKKESLIALGSLLVLVVCVLAFINGTYLEAVGILLGGGPFTAMIAWMLNVKPTEELVVNEDQMFAGQVPLFLELPKPTIQPEYEQPPGNQNISGFVEMWDNPFRIEMGML